MKPIPSSPFPSPSPGGEAPLDHRVGLRVSQRTLALVQEKSILATSFEQANKRGVTPGMPFSQAPPRGRFAPQHGLLALAGAWAVPYLT